MINLFNTNIKNKHDFIMLNKDNCKWFTKKYLWSGERDVNGKLTFIPINSGMGITMRGGLNSPNQQSC